jgi:hypothetical protein
VRCYRHSCCEADGQLERALEITQIHINFLLMTKFSKFGKNGLSGLGYRSIQFSQDQRRIKARAKLKDLKIQGCFEAWKMIKKYQ